MRLSLHWIAAIALSGVVACGPADGKSGENSDVPKVVVRVVDTAIFSGASISEQNAKAKLRNVEYSLNSVVQNTLLQNSPRGFDVSGVRTKATLENLNGRNVIRAETKVDGLTASLRYFGIVRGKGKMVVCMPEWIANFPYAGSECEATVRNTLASVNEQN